MNYIILLLPLLALYELFKGIFAGFYLKFKDTSIESVPEVDKGVYALSVILWGLFRLSYLMLILYFIKISDNYMCFVVFFLLQIVYGIINSSLLKVGSFKFRVYIEKIYSLICVLFLIYLFYIEL